MQPAITARPAPHARRGAVALVLAIVAGCTSGSNGCGSSCGGALKTVNPDGSPIVFSGQKLDNVAQVRVTQSGFAFLNAANLNGVLTALNGNAPAVNIPCTTQHIGLSVCPITEFNDVLIGDSNFSGACDANDQTLAHIQFKDVAWAFDVPNQVLRAKLLAHIYTDPIYIRTTEAHSSLCGTTAPIQARVFYQDELNIPGTQNDTELDLDLKLTPSPDGRMEVNVTDASLQNIIKAFDVSHVGIDGFASPGIPNTGTYSHDACGSSSGSYNPSDGAGNLTCGGVLRVINAECNQSDPNPQGLCLIFQTVRDYLLNTLKNNFAPQIAGLFRVELDKLRCQRSADSTGAAQDCNDTNFRCGLDDNGVQMDCSQRAAPGVLANVLKTGVCVPHGQSPGDPGSGQTATVPLADGGTETVGEHNCEPIPLGLTGEVDASGLTDKVGFPPTAGLLVSVGLGSKTAAAAIDSAGVQLSTMAGTAPPPGNPISVCVPPSIWQAGPSPAAINFDDPNNKPAGVASYDLGFSIASQMINRALFDAYSASLLCVTLSNKTTSFISSGLFKTFLPSLGLVTGGKDVPMQVLLRPSAPPYVRVGRGTFTGDQLNDPLLTVKFNQMNLDFYALVDERQVRLFTLQTDLDLPLGLRPVTDQGGQKLQIVLGSLDSVLTNIKALNNEMLAEDPGVVADLIHAAVRLAQPLLAGLLQPVALPTILNLKPLVGGLAGAVPASADVATDGYQHLAIYTSLAACGTGPGQVACSQVAPVKAQARVAATDFPADMDELRGPNRKTPTVEIEGQALTSGYDNGKQEFSYRVDGGLWSPWVSGPRFTIRDRMFLFPGRHRIEVTARMGGDDRTADPDPVSLEVFESFEAPRVQLVPRADGALLTKADATGSSAEELVYSYRLGGSQSWSAPGPARNFTASELNGRGLFVTVTDRAGRSTTAHFGADDKESALAAGLVGCSSTGGAGLGGLFAVLALGLFAARRRRVS